MFWSHERNFVKTLLLTLIGTLLVCTASDVFLPYIFAKFFAVKMSLHLCVLQHPFSILPFVCMGILCGLLGRESSTFVFSHLMHVLLSSAASFLYLVSFGLSEWMHSFGAIFVVVVLCVMLPCCLSDIVFPLLLSRC
jgi:hypothetical protein